MHNINYDSHKDTNFIITIHYESNFNRFDSIVFPLRCIKPKFLLDTYKVIEIDGCDTYKFDDE